VIGRESLREFVRGENESLREFVRGENESLREFLREENETTRDLIREQREESRQREERLDQLLEDAREFNREILLRNEKVYKGVLAELEEGRRQIQANTQAVLRLLDRFDEPGGAAA
jgi:hypothetical protein